VTIKLGSRGSALAVAQASLIGARIEQTGEAVEIVTITTAGDERPGGAQAAQTNDKARFVKEIEAALLTGQIDLAVHSAKDVPGEIADGLVIVGVPERADARDALCGADSLAQLPPEAAVGTASLRRRSQLLAARPDLRVSDLRGNVDTRLRRLAEGDLDAIVLAAAGLERLGSRQGAPIPATKMIPAPGQGCLALEARHGDERAAELGAALTDPPSLLELTAERAVCRALDASCRTPVGAFARHVEGRMLLDAYAGAIDGGTWVRDTLTGPPGDPASLGHTVGQRLLSAGAAEILAAAAGAA